MRADRLLTILMFLRNAGLLTARDLAARLEVSERTVLRDIDSLSSAGIPVYAERGRHGGFGLLPGWSTDLTGLTGPEARALLSAGSSAMAESLGMAPALASGLRKLLSGMPAPQRMQATQSAARILVRREGFLSDPEDTPDLGPLQQAVFGGRRLRFRYTSGRDRTTSVRTVDPHGLVNAAGTWYLLAAHRGVDRTYRISRIRDVRVLDEPANRPETVDLAERWSAQRDAFRAGISTYETVVDVASDRAVHLERAAIRVVTRDAVGAGTVRCVVEFGDRRHAMAALWSLGDAVVVRRPDSLREAIATKARAVAAAYPS